MSGALQGLGQNFGPNVVAEFLRREKLGTVIRSHEVVQAGVELSVAGCRRDSVSTQSSRARTTTAAQMMQVW